MFNLGLSTAEKKTFEALLASSHTIDVRLTVMDLNHNQNTDVTTRLLDGQVTVDAEAAVTRSLELELLDPAGALHLDSKSPDDGAMFADRMIRVRYCVFDPTATFRVNVPVFTGPITKLERNGASVRIECMGKEVFGLSQPWTSKTWKEGYRTTKAIEEILRDVVGELSKYINVPDLSKKLTRNVSVGTTTDKDGNRTVSKSPWEVAKSLADGIGYQLFYDGNGHIQMRDVPGNAAFTFREGAGGTLKSNPTAGFSIENVVNAVEVFGKQPVKEKGKTTKKQPHAISIASASDPLSPVALGRTGRPRYLPKVIEDESIGSDSEAKSRANSELNRGLKSSIDVMYDTLVIPHLEELDIVRVNSTKLGATHTLKKFAIPLTAAGTSSVGYVKNVKVSKSAIKQLQRRRTKAAN